MHSDTEHPGEHGEPQGGTAAFHPVTTEMMDHAAHEAAALADGVAQGTITLERTASAEPADTRADAPSDAGSTVETAADVVEQAAERSNDAARDVIEATDAAVSDTLDAGARSVASLADEATHAGEGVSDALGQYNAKVMDVVRTSMASTTALFAALVQAKSVPEALTINADHLRRQMETLTSQGRELATLAQRIALDALQPFKGSADR